MPIDALPTLPPKPEPPVDYDCCGGGCADCDLTRYARALAAWKKLEALHASARPEPQGGAAG